MAGGTTENYGYDYPWATVSAGGTTASDTSWTVATQTLFPPAGAGPPAAQFHVSDPALPGETIAVTSVTGGTQWTVVRGAENTGSVAHAAGFTVQQVVPGINGFASFYQFASLGATAPIAVTNTTTATPIASIYVSSSGTVQSGIGAGMAYQLMAIGSINTGATTASTNVATISVYLGGTSGTALASIVPGTAWATRFVATGTALPVHIESLVTFQSATTAVANLQILWQNSNTTTTPAVAGMALGTSTPVNGTSGAAQNLCLVWKWASAVSTNIANFWGVANQVQ